MNSPSSFSLAGRRALITGSSRGIGRALALGFAKAGADIAVHCSGNADHANEVSALVRQLGRRACVVSADLSADNGARCAYAGAVAELGGIDILVCNASVQEPVEWLKADRAQFDRQVAVNLRSTLELCQLSAPGMQQRHWGRILTVGSVQEARPHPHMIIYAATKAAQTSVALNLARQLGSDGITVNNLAPGVILTDRNRNRLDDPAYAAKVEASIPVGFFGMPEDCVGAALLLCSDAGRYITGQNLFVDGGMSLP
jgi:NAD(P)-dependent dehydrogenase (short-subunit alcohol dehydrogenase family)